MKNHKKSSPPHCPYCNRKAERTTGANIYPHLPLLKDKLMFLCKPCGAYVGMHPDGRPLGPMANAALRRARMAAHHAFDPLWKSGEMSRASAYAWLSREMGIDGKDCHIAHFDEAACRLVVALLKGRKENSA